MSKCYKCKNNDIHRCDYRDCHNYACEEHGYMGYQYDVPVIFSCMSCLFIEPTLNRVGHETPYYKAWQEMEAKELAEAYAEMEALY